LVPFAGFIERVIHPAQYPGTAWKVAIATGFDYLALAGIAIAWIVAARMVVARRWDALSAPLYALAIAAIFLGSRGVWEEADAFGRVLTPLLMLAAIPYIRSRPWLAIAPALMVDAPIALTLWQQAAGVARGLF